MGGSQLSISTHFDKNKLSNSVLGDIKIGRASWSYIVV